MNDCSTRRADTGVSVLVAAWNEGERIDSHIQSFLALDYPDVELILSAGGDDDTYDRAIRYCGERVQVIQQKAGEGKQRALANCYKLASGDIFYLTDADCLLDNDAFNRLLFPLLYEGEHAATGTSRPLNPQQLQILPFHIWAQQSAANDGHGAYIRGLLGRNAAVTRHAIETSGGLDFDAPTGTDYHLAQRLLNGGISIRYVGDSVVSSHYPSSISEYRHKQSRWIRNLLLFGNAYGARDDIVATAKTVGLGIAMTLLPFTALRFGPIPLVTWVVLMIHASLARIRYRNALLDREQVPEPQGYSLLIPALAMLDFVISALPAIDLLNRRRRVRW